MALLPATLAAYLRRTEGRLAAIVVAALTSALVVGVVGVAEAHHRQGLLDEAVDRRGALAEAALDVYRALADADATALNAVLVDGARAPALQRRYREDVFDAADALREAAERAPEGDAAARVAELTDLLPEYQHLVETGWAHSRGGRPVGISYLAHASHLVRDRGLVAAEALRRDEAAAVAAAQTAAGRPPWAAFAAGAAALAALLAAQLFLARRTRRRFNVGLVVATALIAVAVGWLGVATALAAGHARESTRQAEQLVAPLAEARNLGRQADGDEARFLIFPRQDDLARLDGALARIGELVAAAREHAPPGPGRDPIERAEAAQRQWREADRALTRSSPLPTYQEVVSLITGSAGGSPPSQLLDEHLSAAIKTHGDRATDSTAAAREAVDGADVVVALLAALAALAAVAGLLPRLREYR